MFIAALSMLEAVVFDVIASSGWFPMLISKFVFQQLHIIVSIILPSFVLFIKHSIYTLFQSSASIHACSKNGCHWVAYDADDLIFNKILISCLKP